MKQKRIRSLNWDEDEKQVFLSVLREYTRIIENKALDTNTIRAKTKAWEEIHKKFNEFNGRNRQLSQLKIQWKSMKINARKIRHASKDETATTRGEARPTSSGNLNIDPLLNPAELLMDHDVYDSDDNDFKPEIYEVKALDTDHVIIENENQQVPKRKIMLNNIPEDGFKSKKEYDYVSSMLSHSKTLKSKEHLRRMEMAEEEHAINMAIHREKLKCAVLEREILELRKESVEKNCNFTN